MSVPCSNVCTPWAAAADVRNIPRHAATPTDEQLAPWFGPASDILFELTGRRWPGNCKTTIRPGADSSAGACPEGGTAGRWACGCACGLTGVDLAPRPVTGVVSVTLDGDILVAGTDYRVDDFAQLVRLPDADGGRRSWPCRQRMDLAASEEGTFEVEFTYGAPPPPMGVMAAAALAARFAQPSDTCAISKAAQTVNRQGVSFTLLDPKGIRDPEGSTGVDEVDWFLRAYAPDAGQIAPSAIVSADVPAGRWAGTG